MVRRWLEDDWRNGCRADQEVFSERLDLQKEARVEKEGIKGHNLHLLKSSMYFTAEYTKNSSLSHVQ
jgi:hypothetical protein